MCYRAGAAYNQYSDSPCDFISLAHSRINIIRPALDTSLDHIRPNLIVRDHADTNLCPRDESGKLRFILNVHDLNVCSIC
jgi:hypothetical protein